MAAAVVAGTAVFTLLRWLRVRRDDSFEPEVTTDDIVDEADFESFPASDPPAWTLGVTSELREDAGPGEF